MKRKLKSLLGVTLLEVMLVLAIAAMIIVMSVRYYQSANSNQQANSVIQQIAAIVAQANSLAIPTGSYSGVTSTTLAPLLPGNGFQTPWGTTMTFNTSGTSAFTIVSPGTPAGVCPLVTTKLVTDTHYTSTVDCAPTGTTDMSVTYTANP